MAASVNPQCSFFKSPNLVVVNEFSNRNEREYPLSQGHVSGGRCRGTPLDIMLDASSDVKITRRILVSNVYSALYHADISWETMEAI